MHFWIPLPHIFRLPHELLDRIFSNFSTRQSTSHWQDKQDLLSLSQVCQFFRHTAQSHLPRLLSVASSVKADAILQTCSLDPTFCGRVQSLVLGWPRSSTYPTRRRTTIKGYQTTSLIIQLSSMRFLTLQHCPFHHIIFRASEMWESSSSICGKLRSLTINDLAISNFPERTNAGG